MLLIPKSVDCHKVRTQRYIAGFRPCSPSDESLPSSQGRLYSAFLNILQPPAIPPPKPLSIPLQFHRLPMLPCFTDDSHSNHRRRLFPAEREDLYRKESTTTATIPPLFCAVVSVFRVSCSSWPYHWHARTTTFPSTNLKPASKPLLHLF